MGDMEMERQEQIARRAFELYERRGREGGHDLEDWQEAERQVAETTEMQVAETGTPEESAPRQFSVERGQQFQAAAPPEQFSESRDEDFGYTEGQAE